MQLDPSEAVYWVLNVVPRRSGSDTATTCCSSLEVSQRLLALWIKDQATTKALFLKLGTRWLTSLQPLAVSQTIRFLCDAQSTMEVLAHPEVTNDVGHHCNRGRHHLATGRASRKKQIDEPYPDRLDGRPRLSLTPR